MDVERQQACRHLAYLYLYRREDGIEMQSNAVKNQNMYFDHSNVNSSVESATNVDQHRTVASSSVYSLSGSPGHRSVQLSSFIR